MRRWLPILLLVVLALARPAAAQAPTTPNPLADLTVTGAVTLVSAANANRVYLNCTNNDAAVNVRWGGATVTATRGQRLVAGGAIAIPSTGAVYMISEGANVTVSCTEELK